MSTYKEIAERSGVSIGTVYRVLHDRGRYSAATAERVRRVASELDYTKNIYASNLSRSRTYRFAVVMPEPSHDNRYWGQPHEGIADAIASLGHYRIARLDFFYDEHLPHSFARSLRAARGERPDGMIIAPSLTAENERLLEEARLETPYVIIDALIPSSRRVGFVGQDSYESGRAGARLLELLTPTGGTIVAVRRLPASRHIDRRIDGLRDYLRERRSDGLGLLEIDFASGRPSAEERAAMHAVGSGAAAFFVANSNGSLFADRLDSVLGTVNRPIVAYDLVEENVRALRAGRLSFLLSQRPREQARIAVEMLHRRVVLGEGPGGDRTVPIDIVSAETVSSHL